MLKNKKQYLWLPYLSDIKIKPKSVYFKYKGGELNIEWVKIHSIMIYGEGVDLPQAFLEKCVLYKIPLTIHRRNMPRAVFVFPTTLSNADDILSLQIKTRESAKKRVYIGKRLIQAKIKSMSWLLPVNRDLLYGVNSLEKIVSVESWHARRYWQEYFAKLGVNEKRRQDGENLLVKPVLDAVSKFVSGVMLRWILYHNLSPNHGFLHKPTDYPSLVYDLMEPYRGFFDKIVFDVVSENKEENGSKLIAMSIGAIKEFMDTKVYVHPTRQITTFHELLHGIVLALRAYLLGETKRFIVPLPSQPNGGRPIKAGYKLYGHKAGITNFWPETKKIAFAFEEKFKS